MASTYSDLKFELIGTGEQSGTWGTTTNTNLGTAIEEAITGSADVTFASAEVTLTLTDTNATQTARNLRLNLTGTSGGAQNLIVPAIEKLYLVNNGCADAITVKNSTGTGVAVPAGKAMLVFNDGTNVVEAISYATALAASGANSDITSLSGLTTALSVAQGGTGSTTADGALDNLGGTTIGKGVFKAATAAAAQQAMDTEVGVDVQAYDAGLADIAGLAVTDGNFIVGDGANWVAESGATARTSLGLGTLATLNEVNAATIADNSVGAAELNVPGNGTAGQYLASDGDGTMTWTTLAGGGFSNMQVFTSPGTWTNPGTVEKVKVTVVGGGGAGGLASGATSYSGGGGGGGAAIEVIPFPSGTNVSVTVGGAGGTSSFGAYTSATGGSAPPTPSYSPGGAGGSGSGGQLNIKGGGGEASASALGGSGGNSIFGGAAAGNSRPGNSTIVSGLTGGAYGGGGGGAVRGPGAPFAGNSPGGAGAAGVVVVEY
jgi:hypothetical protein